MGFSKRWDIADIKHQLGRCSAEMKYGGNDGFTQWDCKKELLEVKYYLEQLLHNAPKFSDVEESYLLEKEQEKTFNLLKT